MFADSEAPADHPVLDAVGRAARRHRLPASVLADMIDAQAARLERKPFADLAALSENIARWDGSQFRLAWHILDGPQAGEGPLLLAAAAAAYGLARVLIEAPVELAFGRTLLPADMMAAHDLSLDGPAQGSDTAGSWRALSATLGGRAFRLWAEAASGFRTAPRAVRLATLPYALVRPYLRVVDGPRSPACAAADIWPLTRVWRLWCGNLTGRVCVWPLAGWMLETALKDQKRN